MPNLACRALRSSLPGWVLVVAVLAATVGCSRSPIDTTPRTIPTATPAASPPTAHTPAGTVHPLAGRARAAIVDAGAGLAVLVPGADPQTPTSLAVLHAGELHTIALPGPASALAGDGHGTAYLATRGGYFIVDLAAGHANRIEVDDAGDVEFTAIARRADGNLVLGSAEGTVYTLASETAVAKRHRDFARVDAIVTQGDVAVVLDRGQTSVTSIGPDGDPRQSLRAGAGATTLAADPAGRVLAADTRGGQLLVFGADPLVLRQSYPVPDAPYGLAGSATLAWVAQTGTNTVVGYDLSSGIPVEKVRYPTVRQPNVLAFDDDADTLYVVSGVGDGVQVIEHPERRR
ncbi:YncE family protein [Mycolicibacillus parakoreensis]|uniref:Uncharacterized protein n=1 Tax=Mycolicibacillus parakoreensis TaxID=1069221 RepID=A0ABY3U2A6_9MYCO|nr:hypothetical protein [Mycolicibacillus parakoreensis]ULN54096.1 hypothetical protein MIU77_07440 [Mycolicibacillus parakoreensis]